MFTWLKRIFRHPNKPLKTDVHDVPAEQLPPKQTEVPLAQSSKKFTAEQSKFHHVLETEFFQIVLDESWIEVSGTDPEQLLFENHHLGIEFVLSTMRVAVPLDKLEACAQHLAGSFAVGAEEAYSQEGIEIEKAGQTVERMSWGYQVDVVSRTHAKKVIRSIGFVSPAAIINLTFTQSSASIKVFDDEACKILATLKFANEMWAGQPIPQEPTFH